VHSTWTGQIAKEDQNYNNKIDYLVPQFAQPKVALNITVLYSNFTD
jgi:hypothetical protein